MQIWYEEDGVKADKEIERRLFEQRKTGDKRKVAAQMKCECSEQWISIALHGVHNTQGNE